VNGRSWAATFVHTRGPYLTSDAQYSSAAARDMGFAGSGPPGLAAAVVPLALRRSTGPAATLRPVSRSCHRRAAAMALQAQ